MSSLSPEPLKALLAVRLDPAALDKLDELSDGQSDFVLFLVKKLQELLAVGVPRLERAWQAKDFKALTLEIHKLRSSAAYVGALRLDQLVEAAEPVLRAYVANGADEPRAFELGHQALTEANSLLSWLNTVLADR